MEAIANASSGSEFCKNLHTSLEALSRFARGTRPTSVQGSEQEAFQELPVFGFITQNHINYTNSKSRLSRSLLSCGTSICRFDNGGYIIETASGHMVETDKRGRIVTVRAASREIRAICENTGFSTSPTVLLPGNIRLNRYSDRIELVLPCGSVVQQKLSA